jgi:uncharacterized protein DUF664
VDRTRSEPDAAADFAACHREIELVREQTHGRSLDESYLAPRRGEPISLRWVYGAMNHECTRRGGPADLLRERIGGRTGH